MAKPRDVSHPIVRTYITKTTSPSGKTKIHARIYSPDHGLDHRGTGTTIPQATSRAKRAAKKSK